MRMPVLLVVLLVMASCKLENPSVLEAQFADPTVTPVQPGQIDEASGMVDSRSQPGNLWIQQDSGSPAELVLLGHDGKVKGRSPVPNFGNRDWEELANGPGPRDGINYLYIGDIGDNNAQTPIVQIYRLPEPANLQTPITQVERINFRYPDGPRDAEAMFVEPQTKDIYIVSKREPKVRLYRLKYPQNVNEVTVAESLGELPMTFVTGAAISPDGREIILRTYTNIMYWKRDGNQSVADALQYGTSRQLPYRVEPQGEAVCFEKDNKGYFTISERASASSVNLFYYARK
ncbi:PE-PGRS family protein [Spirosoma montaniterrae]|uniref:PE-PGRS family protein n=1 Tax=Spirosoma montaniterrae TaxID=1178516 RepID=A0A1P9WXF4_9BACT|nr:PE-PGRS family protein [Spirosoma montaniterrae]AQG80076.1 PE-PGRS family protein [Spirosoma montaniterrae]